MNPSFVARFPLHPQGSFVVRSTSCGDDHRSRNRTLGMPEAWTEAGVAKLDEVGAHQWI